MNSGSLRFWRGSALFLLGVVVVQTLWLTGVWKTIFSNPNEGSIPATGDAFEAFESIAFAREFSERFMTFSSYNFKSTQTAIAFLLDVGIRDARLAEIERLREKIERRDVVQNAKLVSLVQWPKEPERFRADVLVDLEEGDGASKARNQFTTQIEFRIRRTERTTQNPWGFLVGSLQHNLVSQGKRPDVSLADGEMSPSMNAATGASLTKGASSSIVLSREPVLNLRPGTALLVRFPCSIENVELPKGTPVRVKLTTLDISELQMSSTVALESEQILRAVCRDHIFNLKLRPDTVSKGAEPIVVLRLLTMANAVNLRDLKAAKKKQRSLRPDRRFEKSIEDQLGFVVEEE